MHTMYATRCVAWVVTSADRCSLAAAIAYNRLTSRVDPRVSSPPPVLPSVHDVYKAD